MFKTLEKSFGDKSFNIRAKVLVFSVQSFFMMKIMSLLHLS